MSEGYGFCPICGTPYPAGDDAGVCPIACQEEPTPCVYFVVAKDLFGSDTAMRCVQSSGHEGLHRTVSPDGQPLEWGA